VGQKKGGKAKAEHTGTPTAVTYIERMIEDAICIYLYVHC
jgi:hypothetical protein